MTRRTLALACSLALSPAALAGPGDDVSMNQVRHAELGEVAWSRDFDAALAASAKTGRPVLVLFDEVPGCHTCVSYGEDVLCNPLIVEAAETLFHPVAVFNNVEGQDREVLSSFNEPVWNNPVVRVIDAERNMLAPRVNGDYSTLGITNAMVAALEKSGRDVPGYLRLLNEEARMKAEPLAHATFAMHCFWEGQAQLGALDGVVETEVGWLHGLEVVDVTFDPKRIDYKKLVDTANAMQCASKVFTRTDKQLETAQKIVGDRAVHSPAQIRTVAKDELYRLQNSLWRAVPMTPLQAEKVNAALGTGTDPTAHLSPRQALFHDIVRKYPNKEWKTAEHKHNLDGQMDYAEIYDGVMERMDAGAGG